MGRERAVAYQEPDDFRNISTHQIVRLQLGTLRTSADSKWKFSEPIVLDTGREFLEPF